MLLVQHLIQEQRRGGVVMLFMKIQTSQSLEIQGYKHRHELDRSSPRIGAPEMKRLKVAGIEAR